MSLKQWLDNSWVQRTTPSAQEVADLLALAERDIADASLEGMSPDGQLGHAYDAIRSLCQCALHADGYSVPKGTRQHERIIGSLKFTLAGDWAQETDYLDRCRRRRNQTMYDRSGETQPKDADELLDTARRLQAAVQAWLQRNHGDLI